MSGSLCGWSFGLAAALGVSAFGAVTDGLVHHWSFDEGPDWHDSAFLSVSTNTVAFDLVGSADATLRNMAGTNWVSGRQHTALLFDGVDDRLDVATNLAATLGGTASLSLWLRTAQAGDDSVGAAPGVAGARGTGGAQWGVLDAAGRLALAVDNAVAVRTAVPVNDGAWHHIVLTRDSATGECRAYLDGALSAAASGASGARGAAFSSLGRLEGGASPGAFAGRLDQLHVFSRALASNEVAVLYANHAPKCWPQTTEGVSARAFTTASVFARAYDVERDALTVTRWTQPSQGAAAHNGDGSFTYTPSPGARGSDSFAATVSDGQGGFRRVGVTVTVLDGEAGSGVPVTQYAGFAPVRTNGADIAHSGWRVPRALHWNADGKRDLLVGAGGYVWLYTNNGTLSAPSFAAGVKVQAAGSDIYAGTGSSPIALADLTGDGVDDLVVADSSSKLRVYRNTAAAGAAPVYAAYVRVMQTNGTDFVMADRRFDLGDWNGDGLPDLVTGTYSGSVRLYLNLGAAGDPRFGDSTVLFSDSYQLYPRLYDLNGNGLVDLLRGINWGSVVYWRDAGARGLGSSTTLSITDAAGASPDLHALTDGPVVDFGDFTGDGKVDLVVGGQAGGDKVYLASGVLKSIAENVADIEAIYDLGPTNVGVILSANTNALLNVVNAANQSLVAYLQGGTLDTREALYAALTNHIAKYSFLKYQTLDTAVFHHVPSLALQNWVLLGSALADTPGRRQEIADVMGLTGTARTIYLEAGLALGDNAKSIPAAYGTIRDFQRRHPRELFPDAVLTIDQLYGDGRGGFIWTPNSTKNTFGDWAVGSANEWASDLTAAIERVLGAGAASGDYFTFVMGHEVTHSLDGYVNGRANADLRRRWGLTLCAAAGPDVAAGANGWRDVTQTKANFLARGYWDGNAATWDAAWATYWTNGVGTAFRGTSFMRGNIDWFLDNSQESLATQANHHWANGPGRLIGALDRFRRASVAGLGPLRANINEVVTFIDFLSAGMNRVNLVETKYQASPEQVNWLDHYADLERDDRGTIVSLRVDGCSYAFDYATNGVVTNVTSSLLAPAADTAWTFRDTPRQLDVLANDARLEGGPVQLAGLTQPAHGSAAPGAGGRVVYAPVAGFVGWDRFTYTVTGAAGGSACATVNVEVVDAAATNGTLLVEYWNNIGTSTAVSALSSHANYPWNPTVAYLTNSAFELRSSVADYYGTRCRARLVPDVTGDYTFWIASDDAGELWLSADGEPAGKALAAYLTGWAGPRVWNKYASQQSAKIPLVAGQACYLETLHKEGNGGDNLAVAWQPPGATATNVIPAANLRSPFWGFAAPAFEADPLAAAAAVRGQPYADTLAGRASDADGGGALVFEKAGGPAWLSVGADGALAGTPGAADLGTNSFAVAVTDPDGFRDVATLRIVVALPLVAEAGTNYWDNNGAAAGFGSAGGTWGAEVKWSADPSGASAPAAVSTTPGHALFFGTRDSGLGAGSVAVEGAEQAFRTMIFGAASGPLTLAGGGLQLAAPASAVFCNSRASTNTLETALSGAGGLLKAGTLSASSFLTSSPTLVVPSAALADFAGADGSLGGASVNGGVPVDASVFFFVNSGTNATCQLQVVDGSATVYTKCVKVELLQTGPDIYARVVYAKYTSGANLGYNFDAGGTSTTVATAPSATGYGAAETRLLMAAGVREPFLTTTASVAFPGAALADFAGARGNMAGNYISGKSVPGAAYHFTNNGATATYQLQVYNGGYTKCVKVELAQSGPDITARAVYAKYYATQNVNVLGIDFDTASGLLGGTVATSYSSNGYGAPQAALVPAADYAALRLTAANTYSGGTSAGGGLLEVGGSGRLGGGAYAGRISTSGTFLYSSQAAQALSGAISGSGSLVKAGAATLTLSGGNTYSGGTAVNAGVLEATGSASALPESGGIVVGTAGELRLSVAGLTSPGGAGVGGNNPITVSGGTLTLAARFNAGYNRPITIDGGALVCTYTEYEDSGNYVNNLTLLNGAEVLGYRLRLGYVSAPTLTVGGAGPSRIDQGLNLVTYGASPLTLSVADATGDAAADLVIGGLLSDYPGYAGLPIVKSGAGTVSLACASTHSGGITVSAGALALDASGALNAGNDVTLAGGALATGSATNAAGALALSASSALVLGGGQIAFADSRAAAWSAGATLTLSGELGPRTVRVGTGADALTRAQLAAVAYDGGRVYLTAEGFLVPLLNGSLIRVR